MPSVLAAEGGFQEFTLGSTEWWWLGFAMAASLLAIVVGFFLSRGVLRADKGSERMREIAGAIQEGAMAYLKRQFRTIALILIPLVVVVFLTSTKVLKPDGSEALSLFESGTARTLAFIAGCVMSGLTGFIGMRLAVQGNVRTAAAARSGSLPAALQIAFRTGGVAGMFTVGLGLLGATAIIMIFQNTSSAILIGFGFGGSLIALFMRVGGGIFTKAADAGAALVGKIEKGIPEDDPRNPATIADNVGDNVGDCAGMGADLYESYCGSILATAALGVAAFAGGALVPEGYDAVGMQLRAIFLPMALAGVGIAISIWGIYLVRTDDDEATQKTLLKALRKGVWVSTGAIAVAAFLITWLLLGSAFWMVSWSIVVGL